MKTNPHKITDIDITKKLDILYCLMQIQFYNPDLIKL
jgi:hypothetical protein